MTEKLLKILPFVLGFLLIANILFLDFVWMGTRKRGVEKPLEKEALPVTPGTVTPGLSPTPTTSSELTCPEDCLTFLEEKVSEEVAKITPVTQQTVAPTSAPAEQVPKVVYLPLGGSSSSSATDWTDIGGSDFYFDKGDYPDLSSVRWETSLGSFLGGNLVYVRLYDVTNKRAVDASELSASSSTSKLLQSSGLTIWQGNNLYRIQAKSSSGTPAYIDSPRLKIILK